MTKLSADSFTYQMPINETMRRALATDDLKNPIGGIINFTDMLLTDETMTGDQREMLQAIDESAHGLLNMVYLSLDFLKIEQGTYELQPSRVDDEKNETTLTVTLPLVA